VQHDEQRVDRGRVHVPHAHDTHQHILSQYLLSYMPRSAEPVRFDEAQRGVLTPMGQVDSIDGFARGLGARRVNILIGIAGVLLLAIAFLNAVQ
jgi:hypothetical protein